MKQHITEVQLDELNDKGKERLHKWWKQRWRLNDIVYCGYPLLSIGQMIEYKIEKTQENGLGYDIVQRINQDVCDSLWEDIKTMLTE